MPLGTKVCGVEGQRHSSLTAEGEKLCLSGAFTRGELIKQPGGLFFKRGRFTRESVPLLWTYSNLSADSIGTKIKNEVFLQSESRHNACSEYLGVTNGSPLFMSSYFV